MSSDPTASRRKPRRVIPAAATTGDGDAALASRKTLTAPALPPLIVGIGASAGGLEAFKSFFAHMPNDSAMAFVLVQHLAPQHTSLLAELVGRSTAMEVVEASDGERVQPGHVYVIPPDATLTIADGTLQLSKPAPPRQHRWPIDTFFMSLAEDQGDCAACIVLSGSGSDGARGLRAVKEHGGLTLAQAGFDHAAMSGMPASAAATGLVDDVLPVEQMPARLLAHQQQLRIAREQAGPDGVRHDVPSHLREITRLLHADSGHDFSQYKEKTLVRRIQRRMQVLQTATAADYLQRLREEPAELDLLFRELLISVTEFFRDPTAFDLLQTSVFPALLAEKGAADTLRVWVPGCATGEEAYSIAIALKEAMASGHGQPKVQIFATDIDDRAIASARAGRFRGPLTGISPQRLERWFLADGDDFVVSKAIRELCIFSPHSAIKDPPFMRLDLISCRNLLIYMNAELQERLVRVFHYALQAHGYLLLGPSEGLSRNARLFGVVDKKHRLYLRREDGNARLPALPARYTPGAGFAAAARNAAAPARAGAEDLIERNARRVLERHSPAYVVIDSQCDVLRFCGDTGRYLQPSSGAASLNLFALLHKGLRGAARVGVQQAFAQQRPVVQDDVLLQIDGQRRLLQLIVEPLPEADGAGALCVVAFREREPAAAALAGQDSADNRRVQLLEQELEATRLQLQAAIDQQETANEELKSANEEYQSVNEELQSSNEELETSKEEMQSINEELQIVNAELFNKNTALTRANSDLRNLMESTQIATLFLDAQLHVTGFTPTVSALFHLRDGDLGRPITEISSRIPYPDLEADVRQVSRSLGMVERLLQGHAHGPVFLLRMHPYRTIDNVIDGVVLTFTDITERRRHELERGTLAAIVDSSSDIIIGHALDGTITSWNDSARVTLGYPAGKALGKPLSLLVRASAPQLQTLLAGCGQPQPTSFEMEWLHHDGGTVQVAVTCSPVHDAAGQVIAGSLIARVIDDRVRADRALQASERRLAQLIDQTTAGLAEVEADGRFVLVNPAFCEITGRSAQALYALRLQDVTHPADLAVSVQAIETLLAGGPAMQIEKRYLRPDGSAVWVINSMSRMESLNGEPRRILAVVQDISERRRAAQHRELMLGELNHRVKNTLASVQSIALQTLAHAPSTQAFKETFLARLQALSSTHNLLAVDAWSGAWLNEIVLNELAPYRREGHVQAELDIEDLQLTPKTALALSMALHELTTNAVKYGALSVPEGRVAVRGEGRYRNGGAWLHLEWREHGGPPVAPPARRGFGSRLIADGLAFELDGDVALQFEPDGVVCTIDVPLSEDEP
ncbi:chemotaxis protein CheB [Lysobacter koreensis]|uniref:Chemotaxis protein CheB n=1 Tax=Lysobacter koreensis TaxID=266122 RepID=A0ABW2YPL3_9GAMM